MNVPRFQRANFVVRNLDRSLPELPMPRRSAIVLEIPDIDGVVASSREAGLTVYDEEHRVTQDGREGREVGIVDADANLVVIYYITHSPGNQERPNE